MISTPAEALYPNVQIHLVLKGGGWGMISTPAEALYPDVQIHLVLGVGGGVGGEGGHDKHTR